MEKDHVAALRRAVEIAGGQKALARGIREFFLANPSTNGKSRRVSQQTIWYWLNNAVFIDALWWPAIEFVTDNRVTRRDLRPDVFPCDHAA